MTDDEKLREEIAEKYFDTKYSHTFDSYRAALAEYSRRQPVADAPCPLCKGTGKVERGSFQDPSKTIMNTCSACKGKGTIKQETDAPEAVPGYALVPVDVLRFLNGECPHPETGLEFKPSGSDGRYWWRKYLTPYLLAASAKVEK